MWRKRSADRAGQKHDKPAVDRGRVAIEVMKSYWVAPNSGPANPTYPPVIVQFAIENDH